MKKYLPFALMFLGIIVIIASYFFVFKRPGGGGGVEESTSIPEIPLSERPFISLSPSSDGHWLRLNVKKIKLNADSMDYELIYELPDGRTQGVPGNVKISKGEDIKRDLLLGSESSCKYRYDEGVEKGTLTLRFRDTGGKLVGKIKTDFHLQTDTSELTSPDKKFSYLLDKPSGKEFFVTMDGVGLNGNSLDNLVAGPYGVFKATADIKTCKGIFLPVTTIQFPGTVKLTGENIYLLSDSGSFKLDGGKSKDVGIFAASSK